MGAPSVNLKLIVAKIAKNVNNVALRNSTLFYVPPLATTLASFVLFFFLRELDARELNTLAVTIMSAVILSLISTAGIQFLIYRLVAEASVSEKPVATKSSISAAIILGLLYGVALSIMVLCLAYPYFNYVLSYSNLQFSYFAILLCLYSAVWILTAAFWASGRYIYPAFIFALSYCVVFFLSGWLCSLNPEYTIRGYIAGITSLLVLLSVASWSVFGREEKTIMLRDTFLALPEVVFKGKGGMLFQTFFILATFLDKIIVWVSEGTKVGNGIQMLGPYTTGAFLGLVPTFSLVALAYFAEKVKHISKNMYTGTLSDIRRRIQEYHRLYRRSLQAMVTVSSILLISVIVFSVLLIGDMKVIMVVFTIGIGALFFEIILFNAFVLPIFSKSYISTISMAVVCLGEALVIPLVSHDVWYASLGFLAGSFVGFLISNYSTEKLLSEFDYNAFRTFQVAT